MASLAHPAGIARAAHHGAASAQALLRRSRASETGRWPSRTRRQKHGLEGRGTVPAVSLDDMLEHCANKVNYTDKTMVKQGHRSASKHLAGKWCVQMQLE